MKRTKEEIDNLYKLFSGDTIGEYIKKYGYPDKHDMSEIMANCQKSKLPVTITYSELDKDIKRCEDGSMFSVNPDGSMEIYSNEVQLKKKKHIEIVKTVVDSKLPEGEQKIVEEILPIDVNGVKVY